MQQWFFCQLFFGFGFVAVGVALVAVGKDRSFVGEKLQFLTRINYVIFRSVFLVLMGYRWEETLDSLSAV